MKKLKVFESFCGVGSQSMALRNIGVNYEVVGVSEVDKYALLAYDAIHNNHDTISLHNISKEEILNEFKRRNICYNFSTNKSEIPKNKELLQKIYFAHKRSKNYGDIRLIKPYELPDFDLYTYSFPCKNISVAGKQGGFEKESGTQSSLVWECEPIIKAKKPKFLLMENVKNIVSNKHIDTFKSWCCQLETLNYNNYWAVLDSKNYGVPQHRERVIMVSIRKDIDNSQFKMPLYKTNCISTTVEDILESVVEDKYYYVPELYENYINFNYNQKPKNDLIQIGLLNKLGNESTRRIYDERGICPTLNSMNGGGREPKILVRQNNSYRVRKLTPLECWRVMGYIDQDFYNAQKIGGLPSSKLYERAGRGIVVPMLEEVFKELFKDYIKEINYSPETV